MVRHSIDGNPPVSLRPVYLCKCGPTMYNDCLLQLLHMCCRVCGHAHGCVPQQRALCGLGGGGSARQRVDGEGPHVHKRVRVRVRVRVRAPNAPVLFPVLVRAPGIASAHGCVCLCVCVCVTVGVIPF